MYLLSRPRLQDLHCLSRQPEPSALHPAHCDMVRRRPILSSRHKIFYFILHICLSSRLCRKNNVEVFIPDRQPEFPDQKFETVTGNPLFVDESVLVKTKLFNLNYSVAHIIPAKRQCVSITIVVFPPSSSGVSSAGFPRSGNLQRLFKTD